MTSENGPIDFPGVTAEIARIAAPGATIILFGPDASEPYFDQVAKLVGGTATTVKRDNGAVQTTIAVPAAPTPAR